MCFFFLTNVFLNGFETLQFFAGHFDTESVSLLGWFASLWLFLSSPDQKDRSTQDMLLLTEINLSVSHFDPQMFPLNPPVSSLNFIDRDHCQHLQVGAETCSKMYL